MHSALYGGCLLCWHVFCAVVWLSSSVDICEMVFIDGIFGHIAMICMVVFCR